MCRVLYFLVMLAVIAMVTQAQLTFSTDWGNGKRSVGRDQGQGDGCLTEENIYAIYKLIQREAEKFLACQTEGKN